MRFESNFFNPYSEIEQTENRLPHWQQEGVVLFITFRLSDALPKELLDRWTEERECWLRLHPEPRSPEEEREYHERFRGAIERGLDAGHGECLLRDCTTAKLVGDTLQHFDGERYRQIAWVVMPNHVHTLFIPGDPWTQAKLVQQWKGFTARGINKRLGREGTIWQKDYFDRFVRNADHFANCVRYIRENPKKAQLPPGDYLLWESELAKRIAFARQ